MRNAEGEQARFAGVREIRHAILVCLWWLVVLCWCACGQRLAAEDLITLCAYESPRGHRIEYVVPANQFFDTRNSWNPSHQPFPADVRACLERAKQQLAANGKNAGELDFRGMEVAMVNWRRHWVVGGRDGYESVERWYLRFTFYPFRRGAEKEILPLEVVMLLDGTVAEEKPSG